ncbi:aldehyde dehydrogenase [Deinococcus sp. KSM4-11]|uniref:thiamine pyrophosphate-dependent enzyme n=1 Tax=Deinococcus sp. KSM4-11 TaxID=2568654 RepID=UPI0010A48603|nr:thiamine pyrophosphate-dependent enzyme [Deinococcus sp. KSM4-11]THF85447.1 aldehyde dehydrogenase [Deinococcus sp. KSM4-11]
MSALQRREVMGQLLRERGDLLVVTGLGASAWDLASISDSALDFPLWGAMGGAAAFGLGLALAQLHRRVVVFTGDGEMLMALGSLSTIAAVHPANLSLVVLDNERYGETGSQRTHTAAGVDLAGVALACGFPKAVIVRGMEQVDDLRTDLHEHHGPLCAVVKVALTPDPMTLPPRDATYLKNRMRTALLGARAVLE